MEKNSMRNEGRENSKEFLEKLVHCAPEVMGGMAVFAGTRAPVETVTAALARSICKERVFEAYSFLTEAHIATAVAYTPAYPENRPIRPLEKDNPEWVLKSSQVVWPAKA